MDADYSKAALLRFIETTRRQGLYNTNTADGYRAAATRLLEDLADGDDVRDVDVDAAVAKYHNRHPGELTPGSLRTYENRLRRVLAEFVKYTEAPADYKPRVRRLARTKGVREAVSALGLAVVGRGDLTASEAAIAGTGDVFDSTGPSPSPSLVMNYPLRDNFMAQVVLPRNLTTEEARRLCAFIRTLAADFVAQDF